MSWAEQMLIQITDLGFKLLNEISSHHKTNDALVRLSPDNKLLLLEDDRHLELGEVQARTAEILRSLSVPDISLQIFTTPSPSPKHWAGKQAKRKRRTETLVALSVIIYGKIQLCQAVGEFASECDINLQDPTAPVRNTLYKNPIF